MPLAAIELEVSPTWRRSVPAAPTFFGGILVSYSGGVVQVFGQVYANPTTAMTGTGGAVTVVQVSNPGARTITRMRVMTVAAIPGGNTLTVQLNVNGVNDPGLVVAMTAGQQIVDAIGEVVLADGDLFALSMLQTGLETIAIQAVVLGYPNPVEA